MPSLLSASQQRVLDWIENFIVEHGISPTHREIQKGLGYRSSSTIQKYLVNLLNQGAISHVPGKARSLKILRSDRGIALLGVISAHSLIETFPEAEIQSLNLACLPKLAHLSNYELSQHFALRVRGDSMIGALIDDGDVVILRRESHPRAVRNGAIVAARVNGMTTLKYFYRDGSRISLQPANPRYEATEIDPAKEEIEIQGIYVGVIRNLV
jgi:repressor LexA